ncbi:hypothetical protein [Allopontixanthobacter sp.]|uniref:hypothetical protein n=1 Tax=Allopontixanthobacter sp. TaxID=2906452 RepID=UPI002ABBB8E4|nr:hypothetical protein [Allopontixanthobacter sp.]MDZ4307312.1 hypothetical protein [Allopontixanthobacter sp.]
MAATFEALYRYADFEALSTEEIHKQLDDNFSRGYTRRLLAILAEDGLIKIDQYDETSDTNYTLTNEGIERAEILPPINVLLANISETPEYSRSEAPEYSPLLAIPGSDRMVSLDHNSQSYKDVADAIDEAIDIATATKPNDISGDEHHSLITGLKAARVMWNAYDLTYLQLKVGVIMALELAEEQLRVSFKMARGTLLVEAIKTLFN